jgi:hypothetical protein
MSRMVHASVLLCSHRSCGSLTLATSSLPEVLDIRSPRHRIPCVFHRQNHEGMLLFLTALFCHLTRVSLIQQGIMALVVFAPLHPFRHQRDRHFVDGPRVFCTPQAGCSPPLPSVAICYHLCFSRSVRVPSARAHVLLTFLPTIASFSVDPGG